MRKQNRYTKTPMPVRFGLVVLATAIGLILTLGLVAAQTLPDFITEKIGPEYTHPNDVITYTIIAVNSGTVANHVVLSDVLPGGMTFIPGRCTYIHSDHPDYSIACNSQSSAYMWEQHPFFPDKRITTTFAVTVTAGTLQWPLVNHAYLGWDGGQKEMVFTTTVLSAIPDLRASTKYKSGPQIVEKGDVITYTIVAVNSGDPVTGVVLLEPLPNSVAFVPNSCIYSQPGTIDLQCNPDFPESSSMLWQADLTAGAHRITTTFAVTVTAGTLQFPLDNCAYLVWNRIRKEMCVTTRVNPYAYQYLPITARNYPPQPVGGMEIVAENDFVYQSSVTLSLTATLPGGSSAPIQMCISNSPFCTTWFPLIEQITGWKLAEGISGPRTVYARFIANQGAISDWYSDQVYLTQNGNFESPWQGYWSHAKGPFQGNGTGLDQTITLFDESNRARLGDPASQNGQIPVGYAYIAQTFEVPENNPRLSLDYRVHSWDTVWGVTTQKHFDTLELSLNRHPAQITDQERNERGCQNSGQLNPTGTLTPSGDGLVFCGGQPPTTPPNEWDSGWRTVTLDLSAFTPGQSVTLYIATWNREYSVPFIYDAGFYNTYSFIDNVTILGD